MVSADELLGPEPAGAPAAPLTADAMLDGGSAAPQGSNNPSAPLNAVPSGTPEWGSLYSGLNGLDSRLPPDQRAAFERLDQTTSAPDELRARAINQTFVQNELGAMPSAYLSRNWDAVKVGYAKERLGITADSVSDATLYGAIGKQLQEKDEVSKLLASGGQPKAPSGDSEGEAGGGAWKFYHAAAYDPKFRSAVGSLFWKSLNTPIHQLPEAPKDLPNQWIGVPGVGLINPALMGAVWNGMKPALDSTLSPLGLGLAVAGGGLAELGRAYPAARAALATMTGVFTGIMAKSTYEEGTRAKAVLEDTNSTWPQRVEAVTHTATNLGMTLLGALGTAFELFPPKEGAEVLKEMAGKTPAEAGAVLRAHADKAELPSHAEALHKAAFELESINREAQLAGGDALQPTPEPELLKETTTLADLTGKQVRYSGYGGTLIRDAEGNFGVLRSVFKKGQASFIEIADTGKSPEVLAHEVGIVPELGWDAAAKGDELSKEPLAGVEPQEPEGTQTAKDTKGAPPSPQAAPKPVTPPQRVKAAVAAGMSIKNEDIDRERDEVGMKPAEHGESTTHEAEVAKAAAKLAEDPEAGAKLVSDLEKNPRAPSAAEDTLLTFEIIRLGQDRDEAESRLEAAVQSGNAAEEGVARQDVSRAQDAYDRASTVATKVGTASGQSLAFRKLALKQDFSIAATTRRRKLAAGGRELSPKSAAELADLQKQLRDAQRKLSAHEKAREAEVAREPPRRAAPPAKTKTYLADRANEARARIRARLATGRVSAGLDPQDFADHAIVGAELLERGFRSFGEWSKKMVEEFGEAIRPHLKGIFDQSAQERKDAQRAATRDAGLKRQTEKLSAKVEAGDFTKNRPRPIPLTPETIRLKADLQRVKNKFRLGEESERLEARSVAEKAKDLALSFRRAGVLSRAAIIAKLSAVIAERAVMTPIRQGVGLALSKALPGLRGRMESVPTFAGYVRSEAKAVTALVTKGLPGAWKILRMKDTDEQALLEREHLPEGFLAYPSHIHAALHYPIQVSDYVRRLTLINEQDARAGIDIEEPINQMANMQEAWEHSKRSVFLQSNKLVSSYQAGLKILESKSKRGEISPAGKLIAFALEAENPVVRVPVNLAEEVGEHVLGLLDPPIRLLVKGVDGFKGLTYGETDLLLRHLKNGSVGGFLVLLGFLKYKQVGGFFQEGERRKKSDVQPGQIRAGGVTIPSVLLEDTSMQALAAGATLHRTLNSTYRLNDPKKKGIPAAVLAVAAGIADKNPFIKNTSIIGKLMDSRQREDAVAAEVASYIEPGILQEIAAQEDKKHPFSPKESPTPRKVTAPDFGGALKQELEKGFPGERQKLPRRDINTSLRN